MEDMNLNAMQEPQQTDPMALNQRELEAVQDVAARLDITNPRICVTYGSSAQTRLTDFADAVLGETRGRDLASVGRKIGHAMGDIKNFIADDAVRGNFFTMLFHGRAKRLEAIRARYEKAGKSVEKLTGDLQAHLQLLLEDLAVADELYEKNVDCYKIFTIFMEAGKQRLRRERETTLASMRVIARRTGLARDNQSVKLFEEQCQQFEQRLADLELSRGVCLQMFDQLHLLKSNHNLVVERITELLQQSIPQWQAQMRTALGLDLEESAAERFSADKESIRQANAVLHRALDVVLQLHTVGMQKRRNAEQELQSIELRLRMKMLETQENKD